jgi:hypothetical protein
VTVAPPPLALALTVDAAAVVAAAGDALGRLDATASSDVAMPVDAMAAAMAAVRTIGRLPHDLDLR